MTNIKANTMQTLHSFIFILFILFILGSFTTSAQYSNQRVVSSHYEFEEGSKDYVYGDKVVLRENSSPTAKALDTLSIGSEIVIVKKTDETTSLNGLDWNWYKVKVGRKSGYVFGGLIALDRVKFENVTYLVTVAGIKQSGDDWDYVDYKVRARVLQANGEFYGHEEKLNTNSFYIETFDDRGLSGIDNMLVINLFAEACGVDGGQVYLFNDGARLFRGITLSHVSEAGLFWYEERIVFPNDENGYGNIRYEREQGEYMDEELNWSKSTTHSLNLEWKDGRFSPNVDEFEFGEGE